MNVSSSILSSVYLIFLQFGTRLITFSFNQIITRLSTPSSFATVSIQFETLYNSILTLSREGTRNALQRQPRNNALLSTQDQQRENQLLNISTKPFIAALPIANLLVGLYYFTSDTYTTQQSGFNLSLALYLFAALVELLSEPMYIRAQRELNFKLRVRIEGLAVILKAIITLSLIAFFGDSVVLVAFGVGQLVFSASVTFGYLLHYWSEDPTAIRFFATANGLEPETDPNKKCVNFFSFEFSDRFW
jgi:oligosaccharide translocation protein RFT1